MRNSGSFMVFDKRDESILTPFVMFMEIKTSYLF